MADETQKATPDPKKTPAVADDSTGKGMRDAIVKSQAQYTGSEHSDLVEVEITKDGDFYKKGDVDQVHPTVAYILKEKGLIADLGKKVTRTDLNQKDVVIDA